jgi:muconate cycloisomerase
MLNERKTWPTRLRYSPVISSDAGLKKLLPIRLLGFPQVKVKVEKGSAAWQVKRVRKILGKKRGIRIDANMAWTPEEALAEFPALQDLGVESCEQPVAPENIDGLALLTRKSKMRIMVDESLDSRESLDLLIRREACDAVNVRISKCGGLTASYNRCMEALAAGLVVQIGCQVGESSLLSSAHMTLATAVPATTWAEGCFGPLLLGVDPARPTLMFRPCGLPPPFPDAPGLGVTVNEKTLRQHSSRVFRLK